MGNTAQYADRTERAICAAICRGNGLKAKEIGKQQDREDRINRKD